MIAKGLLRAVDKIDSPPPLLPTHIINPLPLLNSLRNSRTLFKFLLIQESLCSPVNPFLHLLVPISRNCVLSLLCRTLNPGIVLSPFTISHTLLNMSDPIRGNVMVKPINWWWCLNLIASHSHWPLLRVCSYLLYLQLYALFQKEVLQNCRTSRPLRTWLYSHQELLDISFVNLFSASFRS